MAAEKPVDVKWTEEQTKILIEMRVVYDQVFTQKRGSAANGWTLVAEAMGLNPDLHRKVIEKKWANLTARYRMLKNPPTGVSTEGATLTPTNWPFYLQLDEFFSARHTINPPFLIDSSRSPISRTSSSSTLPSNPSSLSSSPLSSSSTPSLLFPQSQCFISPSLSQSQYLPSPSCSRGRESSSSGEEERPFVARAKPKQTKKKRKDSDKEDPYLAFLKEQAKAEQEMSEKMLAMLGKFFDQKK